MKSRTRKIGKLTALAASDERRSGELAGRSRQHLDEQLDRLGELNAFRHNYARKGPSTPAASAAHWQDYQAFLHRLDTAVKAQNQIVRDCEKSLAAHRQRWMAKRQRLESLERVLDKYKTEDNAYEARMEQNQLDEVPNSQSAGFEPSDN